MRQSTSDICVGIALLLFCGVMITASYDIRDLGFGGLKPETWPRAVLWALAAVSAVFLGKSVWAWRQEAAPDEATKIELSKYTNAIWCFALFFAFLYTLDFLGMLLGGITFTFALLCVLGGISPRKLAIHALISVVTIGAMWSIFVFGLKVMLPEGQVLHIW